MATTLDPCHPLNQREVELKIGWILSGELAAEVTETPPLKSFSYKKEDF